MHGILHYTLTPQIASHINTLHPRVQTHYRLRASITHAINRGENAAVSLWNYRLRGVSGGAGRIPERGHLTHDVIDGILQFQGRAIPLHMAAAAAAATVVTSNLNLTSQSAPIPEGAFSRVNAFLHKQPWHK